MKTNFCRLFEWLLKTGFTVIGIFACWVIFLWFFVDCRFLNKKDSFFKNIFQEYEQSVEQFGLNVGPDLGPNSLQKFTGQQETSKKVSHA